MSIQEALDRASRSARAVKERALSGGYEMQFFIESWRGTEPVALVAVVGQRDVLLRAAEICASGFGADVLALTTDAFMATDPINPRTGRMWEPGQLAVEVEKHGGLDRGAITEALLTTAYNRAGDTGFCMQRYRVQGGSLRWLRQEEVPGDAQPSGRVPDVMARIMKGNSIDPDLAEAGVSVTSERERAVADFAVVRALLRELRHDVVASLYALPGTNRHRYLEHRMGGNLRS